MDRLTVATNAPEPAFKHVHTSSPKVVVTDPVEEDKASKTFLHSPMSSSSSSSSSTSSSSTSLSSKHRQLHRNQPYPTKIPQHKEKEMGSEFSEDEESVEKMCDQHERDLHEDNNYEGIEEEDRHEAEKEELNDTEDEEKKFQSIFDENSYSSEKNTTDELDFVEAKNSVSKEVLNTITTTTKSVSLNDDLMASSSALHSNRKKQKLEDSNQAF